jgi:peptidyl-prolyl cis-trans isomerase A (cyclophilin A)
MTVSATLHPAAALPVRANGRRAWLAAATLAVTFGISGLAGPVMAQAAPKVKFVTSEGDFVVEVYPDKAPKTVENFLQYVKDKHYDGTVFHRVINNFMVQGGGYDAAYTEKKTRPPVAHEGQAALAKGGPKNVVGTLAMARTNDPNSASSQFFINVKDNDFLNPTVIPPGDPVPKFEFQGRVYENTPRSQLVNATQLFGYTVFGKVTSGMDVVNKIKETPTGAGGPFPSDVPKTPVTIRSASIVN